MQTEKDSWKETKTATETCFKQDIKMGLEDRIKTAITNARAPSKEQEHIMELKSTTAKKTWNRLDIETGKEHRQKFFRRLSPIFLLTIRR